MTSDTSIIGTVPGGAPRLRERGSAALAAAREAWTRGDGHARGLRVPAAGGAVGGARAAALGAPTPGSSSRLRSNHGGGGVRGPSGETESGSYTERERRAGLRRRPSLPGKTTPHRERGGGPPGAGPTIKVVRGRSGAPHQTRQGIRLPPPRSGGTLR